MNSAFAVIVKFVAFVNFLCLAVSGAVLRWSLPPGSESLGYKFGGRFQVRLEGPTVMGWDRHQWSEIHFWLAVAFACVMAIVFLASLSRSESKTGGSQC